MASLLQKLVKKPYLQPLRFLPSFQNPHLPDPPPLPPLLHLFPLANPSPNPNPINRIPIIYPSFPHWCHLEPISISGIDPSDIEADQRTVWADSVKKKRKKKMNKHKYRKLRKRLRRQT